MLRDLLAGGRLIHAPGVTDAVSGHLIRELGFEVAYLSGATTSAVALGLPDLGFVNGTDITALAARVLPSLGSIPLVADADTGYGNPIQVGRTVEQYAAAGIAALHIEDQVSPKRCGHMAGKAVVDRGDAVARIRAATAAAGALGASAPLIIARTDCLSLLGLDEARARAAEFIESGAEMVFVEGVSSVESLAAIDAVTPGIPKLFNRSEAAGAAGGLSDAELADHGVRLVIHPVSALLAATAALRMTYEAIAKEGSAGLVVREGWSDLNDLLGLQAILAKEKEYET